MRAILLLLYSEFLGPDARGARLVWIAAGLALTRAALLGTWHGSLLYVALGEVAIVLYGVARNRADALMAETASVLVSAGFDAHRDDPLASLNLTERSYREVSQELRGIAEQHASGRLVSLLEGGYDLRALSASVREHVSVLMGEES